jgi:hypothetical protein
MVFPVLVLVFDFNESPEGVLHGIDIGFSCYPGRLMKITQWPQVFNELACSLSYIFFKVLANIIP